MSSKVFTRRLFLRGAAGVTVALPLLESLGPREALAQDEPFRFAIFMRQGNGVAQPNGGEPDRFWPTQPGTLTKASLESDLASGRAVGVLADYADKLNAVHGLRYNFSGSGCGHADGCLQCLTSARRASGTSGNTALADGPSIDWVISEQLDPPGVEPVSLYAGATSTYLGDVILYRAARTRRSGEQNPINAYERLFGMDIGGGSDGDEEEQRRILQSKSVNDIVRAEMQALLKNSKLSKNDRARLEAHFDAIRDLEQGMGNGCRPTQLGNFDASDVDAVVRTHIDIIVLAMACGKSHVATLCIGNGNDQTQYTVDGQRMERFHHISHRVRSDGADGDAIPNADQLHHRIDMKFGRDYFKYMLDKLSAISTPTGTLLDDGVAVWFNDLENGPNHGSRNLPWILAGSAGGRLRTGQYLRGDWTINRIHNTIGAALGLTNAAGEPLDDFGDADYPKGHVPGMLV